VLVYDSRAKKVAWSIEAPDFEGCAASDVAWDPLSRAYLLVAYGTGHMILFDVEVSACCHCYLPLQPLPLRYRSSPGSCSPCWRE
jgi:hypothetical protein